MKIDFFWSHSNHLTRSHPNASKILDWILLDDTWGFGPLFNDCYSKVNIPMGLRKSKTWALICWLFNNVVVFFKVVMLKECIFTSNIPKARTFKTQFIHICICFFNWLNINAFNLSIKNFVFWWALKKFKNMICGSSNFHKSFWNKKIRNVNIILKT